MSVRVIARSQLNRWPVNHGAAKDDLLAFHKTAEKAAWNSFAAVRGDFPSADLVGDRLIFNIKGTHYRLICLIDFARPLLFYRWFGTHAEYSKLSGKQLETI